MVSTIHFFTHSNGPVPTSYYDSNFASLEKNLRLSGYPRSVLQPLLSRLCTRAQQEGVPFQVIHRCLDNSIQGILFPGLSAGVFGFGLLEKDEESFQAIGKNPEIIKAKQSLVEAKEAFRRARAFHDEEEKVYLAQMNFEAADRLAESAIHALLGEKSGTRRGREIHRFFGAATVNGTVDYIPEITDGLTRRIFLKGRPGTGKSTFLKKAAAAALRRGLETEIYHCSLDPKSLDMVVVRELSFCLLDSTAPHEYFPSKGGDEIVDLYAQCVTPGTDEAYGEKLRGLEEAYRKLVRTAGDRLRDAEQALESWEASLPQPDPAALEEAENRLMQALFETK